MWKVLKNQIRCYDRKRYLKQKKALAKQTSLDHVKLSDSFALLQKYNLQPSQINAIFTLHKLDKPIRGTAPIKSTSEQKDRILIFCAPEQVEECKKLGATFAGSDDLIQLVLDGKVEFDVCLATKQVFPKVVKIAKVLGPRGLMPSPAKGTVSDDIQSLFTSLTSTTRFESIDDKITAPIGLSTDLPELESNIKKLYKSIMDARPSKIDREAFIQSLAVYGEYSPALELSKKPFRSLIK